MTRSGILIRFSFFRIFSIVLSCSVGIYIAPRFNFALLHGPGCCGAPMDGTCSHHLSQRWLSMLALYVPPAVPVTRIVMRGYLSKRGAVNTSFQKRWFVLSSDGKVSSCCDFYFISMTVFNVSFQLRYYKDDQNGAFKGAIDLRHVSSITQSAGEGATRSAMLWKGLGAFAAITDGICR